MTSLRKNSYDIILREFAEAILSKASVLDSRVEDDLFNAFSTVPRHLFIDSSLASTAYTDFAQPLEFGQIISKPSVVARMLGLLGVERGMRILEIGSGSGYAAVLMATIGAQVYGLEEVAFIAQKTRKTLDAMGKANILIGRGDGLKGWQEHAPFDAITIWTPVDSVEPSLLEQLKPNGGKLIAAVGDDMAQTLHLWERGSESTKLTVFEQCHLLEGRD